MPDIVLAIIRKELDFLGFTKSAKNKYRKCLADTVVNIEIQNNSFDKLKHFLNIEVEFNVDACIRHELSSAFVVWTRVESIDQEKKRRFQACLDASELMDSDKREICLSHMFAVLAIYVENCSTYESILRMIRGGWGEFASISEEIRSRAMK